MKKAVVLLVVCFFVFSISYSIIRNVPAQYSTIQTAINSSTHGDTVLVQPGTYTEHISYNSRRITIASLFLTTQDPAYISQTIIYGTGAYYPVVRLTNGEDQTAVLCGFTIRNGRGYYFSYGELNIAYRGGGICCVNSSPTLQFLNITQNSIRADWSRNGNRIGTEYECQNTTNGTSSFTTNTYWDSTGLTCGISYSFRVRAINGNGIETGWTTLGTQSTLECTPLPN